MQEGIWFAECLTPEAVEVDQYGHAKALHLKQHHYDAETQKFSRDGEPVVLPARIHSGCGGHAAEHGAGPRGCAPTSTSMASTSRPSMRTGAPVKPEKLVETVGDLRAEQRAGRWPRHQLLRRPASILRGQCGEGHGQRQARLSGGVAPADDAAAVGHRRPTALADKLNVELRAVVDRCGAVDAEHRGGDREGSGRGARFRAGAVLSAAELRDAGDPHRAAPRWRWKAWP